MKRFGFLMGCLLVPTLAVAAPTCTQRSGQLLAALRAGDYRAATTHFDERVAAVVTADKLRQIWASLLPLQFGRYDARAEGVAPRLGTDGVVVTPLHFANGWLDMRVTCNAARQISGLRFMPGKAPKGVASATAHVPASGPWGVSRPVSVASPLGPLPAVLTLPHGSGPFPGVVLVAGSGAHDADESVGPNKPFRDIARDLAAHGIASLRYAKRTFVYPRKSLAGGHLTIDDEVTDDAVTAAHQLTRTRGIDPHRVFVLGHSLGAMLAPRIGQRDPRLAGLILMAAPARPLLDVIAGQVREHGAHRGASARAIEAAERAIANERRELAVAKSGQPPAGSFMNAPQSYWMSLHSYHQVQVAMSLHMPMLILQGGKDFQVSPSRDFARWRAVFAHVSSVSLRVYPGLSHLFMPAGATGTAADYMRPGHVSARVVSDIAAWIVAQPSR